MLGNKSTARHVVTAGLVIAIILIIVTLMVSLYDSVVGEGQGGLLRDPEVVAVAIGLVLSVLFVERWRSLEGKVDRLSSDQDTKLQELKRATTDETELAIGHTVEKAEKLSAKLAAIAEAHPWLEVVTERDIIVESDSVRGILRTAYSLLHDEQLLHLYEYLEYCSRKGTDDDPRRTADPPRPSTRLRGTPEDFLEIAAFCEVWLEDYALSLEFIKRYTEAGGSGYILLPDLILRLVRSGQFSAAARSSTEVETLLRRDRWHRRLPFFFPKVAISERYRWNATNALAVGHAIWSDERRRQFYSDLAHGSRYAGLLANEQRLFDAEVLLNLAEFEAATEILRTVTIPDHNTVRRRDIVYLYERLGAHELAREHRDLLRDARSAAYGDAVGRSGRATGPGVDEPDPGATSRHDPGVDPPARDVGPAPGVPAREGSDTGQEPDVPVRSL